MNFQRKIALLDGQIAQAKQGYPDDFQQWKDQTEVVLRKVLGAGHPLYSKFGDVSYTAGFYFSGMDTSSYQPAGVLEAVSLLTSAKLELELGEEVEEVVEGVTDAPQAGSRVFIVHGHDEAKKHELARVIRSLTGTEPVILHEQANGGKVLIEKFEGAATGTGYAVALLTADDLGRAKGDPELVARARQNVVFELGFFFGAFGRDRVAVLLEEGVEEPGDVKGLVYTPLDRPGAWKMHLARELDAAGIVVDWSALK